MGIHLELVGKKVLPYPFCYPKELAKAWPDVKRDFSRRIYGQRNAEILVNARVLKKKDRILDIGTGDEAGFVAYLLDHGYRHVLGIDNEVIESKNRNTMRIDLRDLPVEKTFDVIHFSALLEYFRDMKNPADKAATADLFALKVDVHLAPDGILLFRDRIYDERMDMFLSTLKDRGYREDWTVGGAKVKLEYKRDFDELFRAYRKPGLDEIEYRRT